MNIQIKESLESVKIYGRKLSEFLLPDQINLLAESLQKDIDKQLTLTDVVKSFYCHQQSPMKHNRCVNQCENCASKQ